MLLARQNSSREKGPKGLLAKLISGIAVIAMSVGLVAVGSATAANAAPGDQNSAVVVSEIKLLDSDGNELTEQIVVGDQFTIAGTWDATMADPQPGETFVIGLPSEFEFVLGGPPIELKGTDPVTGEPEVWATCMPDAGTGDLTCTFADIVGERTDVHGTFKFDVEAAGPTNETEVEFDLNGTPGAVELPGGGGIDDGIDLPDSVSKSGVMNSNNWSMTWTIDVPGASLVAAGGNVAHIADTLGAGHVLCDPIGLKVQTVRGDTVVDVTSLAAITAGEPGDSAFGFDLNAPTGGFDSGVTYRIQYQTCTPDGQIDPAGTEYSNSAQIEGWGDAGVGVGTVTNGGWQQNIGKSGSVLGGADRNGKIAWTVTVPGSELVGKDGFNFTEALGAGHRVGADTLSGIRIVEQYGPNPGNAAGMRQEVTGELDRIENSSSPSSFDLDFEIKAGSNFEFKNSDWRYIIYYNTYVDGNDLPEGGTVYTNSVSVDGKVATGTGKVPDRKYDKTGQLNNTAKTLDGVEHSAYTTLDWTVTIPGERIDGLSQIELKDVIGATHEVCVAGDPTTGLEARLGLSVTVRDQIANGGMSPNPSDLTSLTAAAVDGQELTLTITQPAGQTFSRDYQYIVKYTTCTASGGVDPRNTEYTNRIQGSGIDRSGRVVMNYSGSGTGTGVAKGSVAVSKTVTGNGASLVPASTNFTVHVKEIFGGATQLEYDLQVPADGSPVSGFNNRGNGWTFELSEPSFPSVPGVVFGTPQFTASQGVTVNGDGTVATATITPQTNIAVALTNTAQLGQMTVTKELRGAAAGLVDSDKDYSFTAAINVSGLAGVPAQPDRTFTLKAGGSTTLANLPIGAVVTITEAKPADDDQLTWATPVVTPNPVTITAAHVSTPATVTVSNSVSRTVGTFSVSKLVTGAEAGNPAIPASVTVTATWQQEGESTPTSKVLTLPTDGSPVAFGEQLLIGTQVTLVETPLVDGSSIAWGVPAWSGTGVAQGENNTAIVTIGRDAAASVTLTNHAATSTAGLSLIKVLSGEAVGDVPADAEFPVTVAWTDTSDEAQSRELMINANTPTPLGVELPAGTVVTIAEGTRPAIDTVVWGPIAISGENITDNGDGSAELVISDQQGDVTLVSVNNEATWAPGAFSLAKQVEGVLLEDGEVPATFDVLATWFEAGDEGLIERTETITVPNDGTPVDFGRDLPAFTEITLSEIVPDATDRFTWATPTWIGDEYLVVNEDGTATITIQPAGDHELGLTNTAEAILGSLELTKTVSGSGAGVVSKNTQFKVTAEWVDLLGEKQTRELEVSPAKPLVIEGLPYGTEVTLTEASATNPSGARWVAATWASDDERVELGVDGRTATLVVTGDNETPISLALDNKYDEVKLVNTGGQSLLGLALLGGLGLLGGGLLWLRRRAAKA